MWLYTYSGVVGLEPTNARTKNMRLTTWLHPNSGVKKLNDLKKKGQKKTFKREYA
jgi:hypothetical protein